MGNYQSMSSNRNSVTFNPEEDVTGDICVLGETFGETISQECQTDTDGNNN